jgi:hypothetical protein
MGREPEPCAPDPATAAAALADADRATAAALDAVRRAGSGWTPHFLTAYGAAVVVFLILTGTLPGVAGAIAFGISWAAFGGISTWFKHHQQVYWRGYDRLVGRSFVAYFLLWGAAGGIGFNLFHGQVAYWVPAALVVSAPLFVGAWRSAWR